MKDTKKYLKLIQNINLARKCKGAMFSCELLGESSRQLTNFGKVVEERSTWLCKRGAIEIKNSSKEVKTVGIFYSIVKN